MHLSSEGCLKGFTRHNLFADLMCAALWTSLPVQRANGSGQLCIEAENGIYPPFL